MLFAWLFCDPEGCRTVFCDDCLEAAVGRGMDFASSSVEYGSSLAVVNEAVRESAVVALEMARSETERSGRYAFGLRAWWGGVTSGVGGLLWFGGVPGVLVDERVDALCTGVATQVGLDGGIEWVDWLLAEVRGSAGGVGGKSGTPLRRDCEGGLEIWELESDHDSLDSETT